VNASVETSVSSQQSSSTESRYSASTLAVRGGLASCRQPCDWIVFQNSVQVAQSSTLELIAFELKQLVDYVEIHNKDCIANVLAAYIRRHAVGSPYELASADCDADVPASRCNPIGVMMWLLPCCIFFDLASFV